MKNKNLVGMLTGTAILAAGISGVVTRNVTLQEARIDRENAIIDVVSSIYIDGVTARVNPETKRVQGEVQVGLKIFYPGLDLSRKAKFKETPQWYDFGCETTPDPTYISWSTKTEDSGWE